MSKFQKRVIDKETFRIPSFDLKLETEWLGRNFIYLDEIDSTNSYALHNSEVEENGTVVLADKQTSGRGRLDRQWHSAKGQNLTFSLLLSPSKTLMKNFGFLTFGTAVAVAKTIENLYRLDINLKWPNDVLIGRKKLAGILIESSSAGDTINRIVLGIGLNCNQTLFDGQYKLEPTSLRMQIRQEIDREKLLADLLAELETMIHQVLKDPTVILKEWKSRVKLFGEKIIINSGKDELIGIFEDVSDEGYLLLRTQDRKLHTIVTGDVVFLNQD